jgi:hypothetical protein
MEIGTEDGALITEGTFQHLMWPHAGLNSFLISQCVIQPYICGPEQHYSGLGSQPPVTRLLAEETEP